MGRARPREPMLALQEVWIVLAEPGVDVSAGIAGVLRMRESDGEGSWHAAGPPASQAEQLVEGPVQARSWRGPGTAARRSDPGE